MGITLGKLQHLRAMGVLPSAGSVLDIGSSNLYGADTNGVIEFAKSFDCHLDPEFAARIADGSAYGPGITKNESFVGELLEKVGLRYLAFDIANGYRTQIFDLNRQSIPDNLRGSFDTVLNFGTTEHVINQLNSFRVIHDATRVGGHIVHELPTVGYVDHGYFCYTPRLFFELAAQNDYDLIDFAYQGPAEGNALSSIVRDYQAYFPVLAKAKTIKMNAPNVSSFVVLRRNNDRPFRISVELSTSVFTTNDTVGSDTPYEPSAPYELSAASVLYTMPFSKLTQFWFSRLVLGVSRRVGLRN